MVEWMILGFNFGISGFSLLASTASYFSSPRGNHVARKKPEPRKKRADLFRKYKNHVLGKLMIKSPTTVDISIITQAITKLEKPRRLGRLGKDLG